MSLLDIITTRSVGEPLVDNHPNLVSFPQDVGVTSTSAINTEAVFQKITKRLSKLEHEIDIEEDDVLALEPLVKLLPEKSDSRLECDYRLQGLKRGLVALRTVEELEELVNQETIDYPALLDTHKKTKAAVKSCPHGPLKQSLQRRLETISTKVEEIENTHFSTQMESSKLSPLQQINQATNAEELDAALIELMPTDYINLGKEGRYRVAKTLFLNQSSKEYQSNEEVLAALSAPIQLVQRQINVVNEAQTTDEMLSALRALHLAGFMVHPEELQQSIAEQMVKMENRRFTTLSLMETAIKKAHLLLISGNKEGVLAFELLEEEGTDAFTLAVPKASSTLREIHSYAEEITFVSPEK